MSKSDNLQDLLTDVANAIREKKGTTELINPQDFSKEIKSINHHGYTGHADADGLKAIGWTDEDIAYYQTYGVDWDEEDDDKHLVSDDNKALYGVLTVNNISEYKDRIVYLPKIDTSGVANMSAKFNKCYSMVAIPMIDTSSAKVMDRCFYECYNLKCIPPIDTSKATDILSMFNMCYSLRGQQDIDITNATNISYIYYNCIFEQNIELNDIGMVTSAKSALSGLNNVKSITIGNAIKLTNYTDFIHGCRSLENLKITPLKGSIDIKASPLLTKESILYLINNEAAEAAITITLHAYVYAKYAEDADVVEALSNHPNVSLASA